MWIVINDQNKNKLDSSQSWRFPQDGAVDNSINMQSEEQRSRSVRVFWAHRSRETRVLLTEFKWESKGPFAVWHSLYSALFFPLMGPTVKGYSIFTPPCERIGNQWFCLCRIEAHRTHIGYGCWPLCRWAFSQSFHIQGLSQLIQALMSNIHIQCFCYFCIHFMKLNCITIQVYKYV